MSRCRQHTLGWRAPRPGDGWLGWRPGTLDTAAWRARRTAPPSKVMTLAPPSLSNTGIACCPLTHTDMPNTTGVRLCVWHEVRRVWAPCFKKNRTTTAATVLKGSPFPGPRSGIWVTSRLCPLLVCLCLIAWLMMASEEISALSQQVLPSCSSQKGPGYSWLCTVI